jgi:hypothetical protein
MPFCIVYLLFLLLFASEICSALWIAIWYVRERADPETNAISQNQMLFKTKNVYAF